MWADLSNVFVWCLIFVSLSLALLGFIDDLLKIKFENSRGLNFKIKFWTIFNKIDCALNFNSIFGS